MIRVGLLGGSFNPPHVAHQLLALYALETQPLDELWWVPTYAHAFAKTLAPYETRVAMCEAAVAALGPRVRVSRLEAELAARPGFTVSRTLHLLELLAETRPEIAPRLVIGADILGEAAAWHRWDEVVRRAPPIVVGRAGVTPPPGASLCDLTLPSVSSTEVRARLAAGGDVSGLLPTAVLGYIAARGLYRDPP